jgi:hypothetical protein
VVRVSTYPDMVAIGNAYQTLAADKARLTPDLRELATRLVAGLSDERAKVRAIHAWVTHNIRYVAVFLGNGGLVPHAASQVLARRYGDCKDHAILMEALLAAAGIESSGALVNMGDAYTLATVGTIGPTNHVITYVPDLDLYVDSTDPFAEFGALAFEVMDKPTVLTKLHRIGHTPRELASENTETVQVALAVQPDGSLRGRTTTHYTGYEAEESRGARYRAAAEPEDTVVDELLSRFGETGSGSLQHPDPEDLGTAFGWTASFELDPATNVPGPGAMKIPVGLAPGSIALLALAGSIETRTWPYVCQSYTVEESYAITFPDTVTVETIPADVHEDRDAIAYSATYRRDGQTVTVTRRYREQHPSSVCGPEDHAQWRAFRPILQRDLRSQIVYR